jgi:hypothetical protein
MSKWGHAEESQVAHAAHLREVRPRMAPAQERRHHLSKMQVQELGETMTRTLIVAFVLFASGAVAQPVIKFMATRVTGSRAVFDMYGKKTPMQAHYILDEQGDASVCTRLLYHESGHFTAQEMPAEFCR